MPWTGSWPTARPAAAVIFRSGGSGWTRPICGRRQPWCPSWRRPTGAGQRAPSGGASAWSWGRRTTWTRSSCWSRRQSFLTAYATRIGQRLAAVNNLAAARAGEVDLLPVLRSHEVKVAEEFDRLVPHTVGRSASVSNGEGWAAGIAAADLAVLDVDRRLDAG
jgi:hypothetical protein